ncbi:MAG: tRNA pseudouridine(13) synthase TruD [Candidatus Bathyarchaeota archaeon]|nr:tRNA pseudouridine(13) synthase TruD [Candidatus Bathyarchaeota archaeon]
MFVPKLEKFIGIEVYVTSSLGIGGSIRQYAEDFVVEEILVDGSKAEVNQCESHIKHNVLGSSLVENRYLLCVLVKRNWDTFLALKAIAEQLDISTKYIQIAGIKDAKAVTAQHITVKGMPAEEVQKAQVKDTKIRPIGYFRSKLSSYYLLGNHFCITVRAISRPKSTIKERITKIIEELEALGGVPNFFGHQRFGTIRPITHLVGKAIVQGNFEKAATLFLAKPSSHEHPESRQAREQLLATQDFKQALKNFPKKLHYERLMLRHLARKPDDFIGAFRTLPIKLRELFPQAYQAYLFNKFLSRRIKDELPLNRAEVGDHAVNVERSGLPMIRMHRIASTETVTEINKAIQAGKMRLAIPLVGFKQQPSRGVQGEIEKQILEEEGISPENFKIDAMTEISARGQMRTVITPLNNFLLEETSADSANPSKRKVKVSFMLHRGSYATIVLREIMKPRNLIRAGF